MFSSRLDGQKQEEVISVCHQIFAHRDAILESEFNLDPVEQAGVKYMGESTFDDLFVHSFQESFLSVASDSSEEKEEDEEFNPDEEEKTPFP